MAHRRRRRTARVSVSVGLLGAATVLVALAVVTTTWLAIGAVALAWAALRVMWTEVADARRVNAADRAAAATAYRTLWAARTAEHAEFTTAMTERLAEAHLARRELEGLLAVRRVEAADELASWEAARSRKVRRLKRA